jgi:hypothetical protein
MTLKNGTDFKGLKPEIILGAMVAHDVYTEHGYVFCITSGLDGKHKEGSLHYVGMAIDLRTKTMPKEMVEKIAQEIRTDLNEQFDVVVEVDHIHIEFDPGNAVH